MKLTLYRTVSGEFGTFGILCHGHIPLCVTLEDPWKENKIGESCIPPGTYKCTPHNGTKYKNVWILNNVPGRSAILIHQGNSHKNTEGCILVGESIGLLKGLPSVLRSRVALSMLRRTLPKKFELEIKSFIPQVFTNPPKPKKLPFWRRFKKENKNG